MTKVDRKDLSMIGCVSNPNVCFLQVQTFPRCFPCMAIGQSCIILLRAVQSLVLCIQLRYVVEPNFILPN